MLRATLSDRFGAAARAAGPPQALNPGRLRRPTTTWRPATPPALRPAGAAVAGLAIVLAAVVGLVVPRLGATVGRGSGRTPAPSSVNFAGVGYGILGVAFNKRIPQRGGAAVEASGVFEILKLGLRAADRRPHVVSSDLLSLRVGPTYYAVSSPDAIGLVDRRWGAVTTSISVPAHGVLTVKAVFDVPVGAARLPAALHIGSFGYVGRPVQTLRVPARAGCCPAGAATPRRVEPLIGQLTPSPVLGAG